jgi:hypothetical protein
VSPARRISNSGASLLAYPKAYCHPRDAVIGHHFIETAGRRLRLFTLMGHGLIGGGNPGV